MTAVQIAFGMAWIAAGVTVLVAVRAGRLGLLSITAGALLVAAALVQQPAAERLWAAAVMLLLPLVALHYPNGALPRVIGPVATFVAVGVGALAVIDPSRFLETNIAGYTQSLLVMACTWWRYETAGDCERRSVLWLTLAAGAAGLVGLLLVFAVADGVGALLASLVVLAVPLGVVVGVLRPDVIDIRTLIVRTAVLFVVVLGYTAVFAGTVAAAQLITGAVPGPGPLAVLGALVATGLVPVRSALRNAVDRMLFGDRAPPLLAASHVGDRLTDDPEPALRALREALAVPYAALVRDRAVIAASGPEASGCHRLPLRVGDREVGELIVGPRPGSPDLDDADRTALRVVAPALAQALLARDLAEQLQDSRADLIAAVEEERRRLRRDLHDGLGPTLTGVAYAADAARNTIGADPEYASHLLQELRSDVTGAITEVRRLVEGLRPPALDELGLSGALATRVARMFTADGRPLRVHMDLPTDLPTLPAAIEVAAYRIVTEALTNVARHAGCAESTVRLTSSVTHLHIAVQDRGTGAGPWTAGTGLTSMRERAEQLGGTFRATQRPDGGHVEATLPLEPG